MSDTKPNEAVLARTVAIVPTGGTDKIEVSVKQAMYFLSTPSRRGVRPNEGDCIKFLMKCKAKGLNPWEDDAFLIGFDMPDGSTKFDQIIAHQAFLKRAELSPEFDGFESGVTVEVEDGEYQDLQGDFHNPKHKLVGGWCRVHFKTRKTPMYKRLDLTKFFKNTKIWRENSEGMVVKCSECDCLRASFPTLLGGLYIKEEMANSIDVDTTVTSMPTPDIMPGLEDGGGKKEQKPKEKPNFAKTRVRPRQQPAAPPAPKEPDPQAEEEVIDAEVEEEGPAEEDTNSGGTPLQVLVGLLKDAELSDEQFLKWAHRQGVADDDTLDITDITKKRIISVINNWAKVQPQIESMVEGGSDE